MPTCPLCSETHAYIHRSAQTGEVIPKHCIAALKEKIEKLAPGTQVRVELDNEAAMKMRGRVAKLESRVADLELLLSVHMPIADQVALIKGNAPVTVGETIFEPGKGN